MPENAVATGSETGSGLRLQAVRIDQCMTQAQFARLLGVSVRTYHSYERESADLSLAVIAKLHELYNISSDWLLFGIGLPTRTEEGLALRAFAHALEQYRLESKKAVSATDFSDILERWFGEMGEGRLLGMDAVRIWIDILEKKQCQ
ncbi:helix-turn-helix domain-containing protein [Pseudoruegeria sp. SK021]|uniref:helix-turn-helix domain-containing protein n=1 Tax=Pseudoruegeria sp. SK021 TaxID=1933035 RepID=UPI000A23A1CF|nr:helix-turn-helix transcriptional regulator [Pseudoruegeria sp. SK021]OSP54465.1 hypothetical protein BV911_12775 [Pseudoruegeria sp. SK021]